MVQISDDLFAGAYDADGSFNVEIAKRVGTNGNTPFTLDIIYDFNQTRSKGDLVVALANKFGIKANTYRNTVILRARYKSFEGQKLREFFAKNKPYYPGHLRDYLLTEEIIAIAESSTGYTTKENQCLLISLAYKNTNNLRTVRRETNLSDWITKIGPSVAEFNSANQRLSVIVARVEQEVLSLTQNLPNTVFSNDYVRGAHFGDGSLNVHLGWGPNESNNRFRTLFSWSITGQDEAYCRAFINTLGVGSVVEVGPNCDAFNCGGLKDLSTVCFPLFEGVWMPSYKAQQMERIKKAMELFYVKRIKTKQDLILFLDLIYDVSEKGKRKYTKEQYLNFGSHYFKIK